MEPYEVYKIYVAIKCHFNTPKYDFFENAARTRANFSSFQKRKDKSFFHRIAKKHSREEFIKIFVSNVIWNKDMWIGDIFDDKCITTYYDWLSYIEALSYNFEQDLLNLKENYLQGKTFNEIMQSVDGQHPILLLALMRLDIKIETFVVLNYFFKFYNKWSRDIEEDVFWPNIRMRCEKYQPFIEGYINEEKINKIMKELLL